MAMFTANSDYEESGSDLIRLRAGEEITVGPADLAWPGWVWATDERGDAGYVPDQILNAVGHGRCEAIEDFDPEVLKIRRGDRLESMRHIHGWHWCRNVAGGEGWVAAYLLNAD